MLPHRPFFPTQRALQQLVQRFFECKYMAQLALRSALKHGAAAIILETVLHASIERVDVLKVHLIDITLFKVIADVYDRVDGRDQHALIGEVDEKVDGVFLQVAEGNRLGIYRQFSRFKSHQADASGQHRLGFNKQGFTIGTSPGATGSGDDAHGLSEDGPHNSGQSSNSKHSGRFLIRPCRSTIKIRSSLASSVP